jgi:hypothetical protein
MVFEVGSRVNVGSIELWEQNVSGPVIAGELPFSPPRWLKRPLFFLISDPTIRMLCDTANY